MLSLLLVSTHNVPLCVINFITSLVAAAVQFAAPLSFNDKPFVKSVLLSRIRTVISCPATPPSKSVIVVPLVFAVLNTEPLLTSGAGGIVTIGVISHYYDYSNNVPDGTNPTNISSYYSEYTGDSRTPKLEITYASPGYGNDVSGIDSGDISTVNGIATANISKVNGV